MVSSLPAAWRSGAERGSREYEEKGYCDGACRRHVVLPFQVVSGLHQIRCTTSVLADQQ